MANNTNYNLDKSGKEHEGKAGREYDALATQRLEQLTSAVNNLFYSIENNLKNSAPRVKNSPELSPPIKVIKTVPQTNLESEFNPTHIDTARASVDSALGSLQQLVDLRGK